MRQVNSFVIFSLNVGCNFDDKDYYGYVPGGVPERLKGPVSKTGVGFTPYRGFESLLLRCPNDFLSSSKLILTMLISNKITVSAFLTVVASAVSSYFSFSGSSNFVSLLIGISLLGLAGAPLIIAYRVMKSTRDLPNQGLEGQLEDYEGPSDTTAAVLLIGSVLSLGLLLVFPVRWPASVAFALSFMALSLSVARKTPLRDAFVALFATFCLWPVASPVAERFETKAELYLSRLVGDRLDMREVLNYPEGRVVQTIKGETIVGQTDGRLTGLRLGAIVACVVGLVMRRGPIHVLTLTVSGIFWALVLNGFWVYGRVLSQNEIRGWETIWGKSGFALLAALVLIASTDQLLLVFGLLNPLSWIKRDKSRKSAVVNPGEVNMGGASGSEIEEALPVSLPSALFYGIGTLAMILAILGAGQSIQRTNSEKLVRSRWQAVAASKNEKLWPDRLGRWARTNTPLLSETPGVSGGSKLSAVSAFYTIDQKAARVSWAGPYKGWNDRFLEFQSLGWSIASEQVVTTNPTGKPYVLMNLSQPTGEKGFLVYAMDKMGGDSDTPSVRSLSRLVWWHFLQGAAMRNPTQADRYLTEIFYESFTAPKAADQQALGELLKAAMEAKLPQELSSGE